MAGVFPNETSIYVVAADVVSSGLVSSDKIIGEISNWGLTGGELDVESIAVIGGFVDKESPRTQFEMSFDVIVQNTAVSTLNRWDDFKYGSGLTSATEGDAKAIWISHITGGFTKLLGLNNCRGVQWDPNMDADDMLRGTMTFKFSPTTELGTKNLQTTSVSGSTLPSMTW